MKFHKNSAEYTSLYRSVINKLIDDITLEIPTDNQHQYVLGELKRAKQSLAYTAPEILDNCILKILNILRLHIPWNSEESKNPQWIKNIRGYWTRIIKQIDDGLEVADSINTNSD
tara:strand:- start:2297 stop:2641 length:345 start_codon:yes stop_codon:yes gene_type:complete